MINSQKKQSLLIVLDKSGHLKNGHVKAFKNMIKKKKFFGMASADVRLHERENYCIRIKLITNSTNLVESKNRSTHSIKFK